MALAPLQYRKAAANARGAPSSFALSSRFSRSRASVAAARPFSSFSSSSSSSLLAQKKQQTLSSLSSPIRGSSLIAMAAGELVFRSRKEQSRVEKGERESENDCSSDRVFFFLLSLFFSQKTKQNKNLLSQPKPPPPTPPPSSTARPSPPPSAARSPPE